MSSKSKSAKAESLIAAIQQKAPTASPSTPEPPPQSADVVETTPPLAVAKQTKGRRGQAYNLYLHDEDRRLLRELSAWLAGQGERPTDSVVIRSALRIASTGSQFLKAYRQVCQSDGRFKPRKAA
jgi:hypothetical protein